VVAFEITSKYQYKGMLYTAIFVSVILVVFGLLRLSEVLKYISYSFISALSVYVALSIIVNQAQYILGINSIQSSQGLLENFTLLSGGLDNVTLEGVTIAALFMLPIFLLKIFLKGFSPFFFYIATGCAVAYINSLDILPGIFEIKTIGKEIITGQSPDNILTIANTLPSQTFLANALNYAFVISLIIASQVCFCTNVSSSITGDNRVQTNAELISTGISNLASIACGGLFVSPNMGFTLKNVEYKIKTIISSIVVVILSGIFIFFSDTILRFVPINCISSILIIFASSELINKKVAQYFNLRSSESYIFFITLIVVMYFGFISATIVGFTMSSVFFAKRMVRIKDATVHTTKDHDTGAVEFMANKNGLSDTLKIPEYILKKIEVIQVTNILFLNIAKLVEENLSTKGKFPSALIIYLKNVPYIDGEGLIAIKQIVKNSMLHGAIVVISGTNGVLLNILQQKAEDEKADGKFGYIIPNFSDAIRQTVKRLEKFGA
jgi:SulP family sulfate permease